MSFNKTDKSVPCYGCEKRHKCCWSSCAEYKAYSDERTTRAEVIRENQANERQADDVRFGTIKKITRKAPKLSAWRR